MKSFFLLSSWEAVPFLQKDQNSKYVLYYLYFSGLICIIILAHNGQHRGDRVREYSAYNSAIRERGQRGKHEKATGTISVKSIHTLGVLEWQH